MTERNVDLCIIGAAGAGLISAVSAREHGIKRVLVLEKMKIPGGCTRFAYGLAGYGTKVLADAGIVMTPDECFIEAMKIANWRCDAKLVHKWFNGTAETVDWLSSKGMTFRPCFALPIAQSIDFGITCDEPAGITIVKTMLAECERLGIDIVTGVRAKTLLRDNSGAVVGVLAENGGGETVQVNAKAVVLASGTISGNKKLIRRFFPEDDYTNLKIMANLPHSTGDGLLMCEEIGAYITQPTPMFIGPHNHPNNVLTGNLLRRPQVIKINKLGERYLNEDLNLTSEFQWFSSAALDRQPGKVCYGLMDESILTRMIKERKNYNCVEVSQSRNKTHNLTGTYDEGVMNDQNALKDFEIATWLDNIRDNLDAEIKAGRIAKTDTLEEAAAWAGIPAEALKAAVSEYNGYCEAGYDADFLKKPAYLWPLTTPPYYVFLGLQGVDSFEGGIRIDHNLHIVDQQNIAPIPGLYGAGTCTSGWLGHNYSFMASNLSFVSYSGYNIGRIVANEI